MPAFYGYSVWRGLDGRTTRKTYRLRTIVANPPEDQFLEAVDGNDNIVTAMAAISNATLQDKGVSYVFLNYEPGAGDLSENALINVWAQDPLNTIDVLALSQVTIPAPIDGIFLGASGADYNKVDRADAGLQTFIDALADYGYISDLEVIDTGAAINGMENGRRVTRKLPKPT